MLQSRKTPSQISFKELDSLTDRSASHELNAKEPIFVTESGISIETSELHESKAESSIVVTELGILTYTRELQPQKAR